MGLKRTLGVGELGSFIHSTGFSRSLGALQANSAPYQGHSERRKDPASALWALDSSREGRQLNKQLKQSMREGIVREFGTDMYTLLYLKWITNKDLLYSAGNSAQYYVTT